MSVFEDRLQPSEMRRPWRMDLAATALLAGVCMLMLPGWNLGQGSGFTNFQAQLAGVVLLPAMGMVLAMRRGAIDLGVWGVMALGGVTAAMLINLGWQPTAAFTVAVGAGAAAGLLSGLASSWGRVPSPVSTLLLGGAAVGVCHWLAGGAEAVAIPEFTFEGWKADVAELVRTGKSSESNLHGLPVVLLTRMLFVAGCWAVVMLAMVMLRGSELAETLQQKRIALAASLTASGALAAAGGAAWLIDHGSAPVPGWFAGDLRIPAAAVLSGALVCAGNGRVMLAGVWLPVALLVATMWRQQTFYFDAGGYELQLLALAGEALLVQWAARRLMGSARWPNLVRLSLVCGAGGLVVFGASAYTLRPALRGGLQYASLAVAFVGAVLLIGDVLVGRRRANGA